MPVVSAAIATSVAANSTSANIMAGSLYEVLSRPSIVEFGLVGSAPGLLATVMIAGEVLMQDQEISGANRFPIIPDDWILKAAGRPGSKIYITMRNRTGAPLTFWAILNITPVA